MKKTILCCMFILFPLFVYAQSAENSPVSVTSEGNLASLFKVLETNLGEKMLDKITEEGGTILYDEASFLSTPYITSVIAPIEYASGEWKKLAYVKIFNLKEFLLTIESDNGMLNLQFPSGRTTVIGGSHNSIETVDSGTMLQEYDDVDNTISINQMMPPWGGMFWMYFWMYFWMLFMGPIF